MRIRIKEQMVGDRFAYYEGEEVEVPSDVALAWIQQGRAERIPDVPEMAVVGQRGEQAVLRRARGR